MALIYEDRTKQLKGMFFEVQNEVGLGRKEEAYHQACVMWLKSAGIPFASKAPHRLMLGDDEAYVLYPDFVLQDSITVELKALPRLLTAGDMVQLYNYLKFRGDRVGFLVNMGMDRVMDERVVYDAPSTKLVEDWQHWTGVIDGHERKLGADIREALGFLYQLHGTGYGLEVLERLVVGSIARMGLSVSAQPVSKAYFRQVEVDESPLDCLIVENRFVIVYTALFDDVRFSINRGLSYLRALGLEWGVAVDFGKHEARITGLRQRINQK